MIGNLFKRSFLHFFPIPKFLTEPAFGLDISDESLKFLELVRTRNGLSVNHHGEVKIPTGIIEAGKIKDPVKMGDILLNLKKKEKVNSVRVSIPEQQMYLFQLRLDKAGLVNVRESIELVLEEHVPIKSEDAIFDYEVVNESPQNLDIQVAVIPKDVIENYLDIFKYAQINVKSFELEAQAIARAVVKSGDLDTYMLVDFGEKRTGIFILSKGVVMFTSTLDVGGVVLNEMIAKNFKVSMAEAEQMKKKYGLQRNTENKEIFPVILNSVSILRDELVKHFLYWHTHKDEDGKNNSPIKKIILSGGDSNLLGLVDYLAVSMKTEVDMANVWINILDTEHSVPEIGFKEALSFATALGLSLRDVNNI